MKTLPDYLREDLLVLSIGLNPSLRSVKAGFYFANPTNRFWRALVGAGLIEAHTEPSVEAQERLFFETGMGFTDLVKRPTAGLKDLNRADYETWGGELLEKLRRYRPAIAWFHGKHAYGQFCRYTLGLKCELEWGLQAAPPINGQVFVTPNPSAANAAFSLEVLTAWYRKLADLMNDVTDHRHASQISSQ